MKISFQTISTKFNIVSCLLLVILAAKVCVFSWCINRGFDFSDEAFGYLGFLHPEEVRQAATFYAVLYDSFFGWLPVSIINVRIIRLLLLVLSSSVFALGLISWASRKEEQDATSDTNLSLFILIGAFFVNAGGTQALTYNLFSTFLFLLATGIFFHVFQNGVDYPSRREAILFFGIGSILWALFLVKFSNALFLSLAFFLLLIYDKRRMKPVLIRLLAIICGGLTLAVFMFGFDFAHWMADYYDTLTSLANTGSTSLIQRYKEDVSNVTDNLLFANGGYIIASVVLLVINGYFQVRNIKLILASIFGLMMAYVSYDNAFYLGGIKHIYALMFFYILLNFILICGLTSVIALDAMRKQGIKKDLSIVTLLLFLVPFFGSIGTTNYLSVQFVWYAPFIFALLFFLLKIHGRWMLGTMLVVVSLNSVIQDVYGLIYSPYRINGTLLDQAYPLSANVNRERILLDKDLKESVENVWRLVRSQTKYSNGGPVFSFRYEYGFIYFLRGTLPGWSWYTEEGSAVNCTNLNKSGLKSLQETIFILPENYVPDSIFVSCLKRLDIDFPAGYREIGKAAHSIEGINRPLRIYAPLALLKSNNDRLR